MTHDNERLLRRTYEAFANGDMATLDEVFADDVAYHVHGEHPMAGHYRSKEKLFGLLATLGERTGGTLRIDVNDVVANDDHAVGLVTISAQRQDKSVEVDAVQVHRIRDGRIAEAWPVPYTEFQQLGDPFMPQDDASAIGWAHKTRDALDRSGTGGSYVNARAADDQGGAAAAYGDNLDPLREIKRRYDPQNLLSGNQNIQP